MILIPRDKVTFTKGYWQLRTGACFTFNQFCYLPLMFYFPTRQINGSEVLSPFIPNTKATGTLTVSGRSTPIHFLRKLTQKPNLHPHEIINNLAAAASFLTHRILAKKPTQAALTPLFQALNYHDLIHIHMLIPLFGAHYEELITESTKFAVQGLIAPECKFQQHQAYLFVFFCILLSIYDSKEKLIGSLAPYPELVEEFKLIFGFPLEELV